MRKVPLKPTQPYGFISFSKTGEVTKSMFELPKEKELQEETVIKMFLKSANRIGGNLSFTKRLPEKDNDFLIEENNHEILVEITELLFVDFIDSIVPTTKAPLSKLQKIKWVRENKPYVLIDSEEYRKVLVGKIKTKIKKAYDKVKNLPLWLLVFSTFPYEIEYYQQKQKSFSPALVIARDYLARKKHNYFDEIWFFDLIRNPVRIWPL